VILKSHFPEIRHTNSVFQVINICWSVIFGFLFINSLFFFTLDDTCDSSLTLGLGSIKLNACIIKLNIGTVKDIVSFL